MCALVTGVQTCALPISFAPSFFVHEEAVMLKALLALITAALFAGAALYVSLAEHPARMRLDDRSALAHWKPSYARATWLQASLAQNGRPSSRERVGQDG